MCLGAGYRSHKQMVSTDVIVWASDLGHFTQQCVDLQFLGAVVFEAFFVTLFILFLSVEVCFWWPFRDLLL